MKKYVAILSLILLFVSTVFVNLTYASQYSLSNEDTHTSPQGVSPQAMSKDPLVGTVAETMNSGGYTYILLQTKKDMVWVAIPESKVTVGEDVVLAAGFEMIEYKSPSLNRTFDSILFSEGLISQGGSAPEGAKPHKKTLGSSGAKPSTQEDIKVEKADGGNAYTVAELFKKRKELDNKDIILKGKVVKVTARIMNKNWLHIQDGTGNANDGTNDMVVTTMDLPSVGDTVTIKGVLFSDKDFGSGYKYNAIVEFGQVSN
ncbi:MAG: DNA-binding protein [Candidatus Scalindua sp.]|nr:DNA-binding protein [Candidatus Scalindua sp.]MCR4345164.1 DNA-binding protein [Candidatus Scalindua sp.]